MDNICKSNDVLQTKQSSLQGFINIPEIKLMISTGIFKEKTFNLKIGRQQGIVRMNIIFL